MILGYFYFEIRFNRVLKIIVNIIIYKKWSTNDYDISLIIGYILT